MQSIKHAPPRMPRRRHAFTLIELMVAISVMAILMAITMPVLSLTVRDTRVSVGYHRCIKVLKDEEKYLLALTVADLDRAEPRVPAGDFSGVAVVFYEDAGGNLQARLAMNNQAASEPDPTHPGERRFLESTLNTARVPALPASATNYYREPYDVVSLYEPVPMPSRVRIYGLTGNPTSASAGTAPLIAMAPPFACCVNAMGYAIAPVPPQGRLEIRLDPNSQVRTDTMATSTCLLLVHEEDQAMMLANVGKSASPSNPNYGLENLTSAELMQQFLRYQHRVRLILMGTQSMSLLDY